MIRKFVVVATGTMLGLGGLATASSSLAGAAPAVPFDAVGTVHCSGPGKVKITPPVTNTPAEGTRTVIGKFNLNCTNGGAGSPTGNPSVKVNTGKVTLSSTSSAASTCANLLGTGEFVADIKWKSAGGKVNPTHIVWSGYEATESGFNLPGTAGTSTVTGSYAGESASLNAAVTAQALASVEDKCAGKGVKKFNFSPSSTFDLS